MLIRCPKCATEYNFPRERFQNQAMKMRCNRCSTVFALVRRNKEFPQEYEEYVDGQLDIPEEFAFLQDSAWKQNKPGLDFPSSDSEDPEEKAEDTFVGYLPSSIPPPSKADSKSPPAPAPESLPKPPPPPSATLGESKDTAPSDTAKNLQPTDLSEPTDAPPPQPTSQPPKQPPQPPAGMPKNETQARAPKTTPKGSPIPDMYTGSAWQTEKPLDLGDFAVSKRSSKSERIGKFMAIFTVSILFFMLFVTYRNGWRLSLPSLPSQIVFAFSGEATEDIPATVEGLETTIDEKRVIFSKNKTPLLVVTGKVFNNSPVTKAQIVLRCRLIDPEKNRVAQVRAPCDKVFEDSKLRKAKPGTIDRFYRHEGELYNCRIRGESSTLFQIVFENPPSDYDQMYSVEVTPISAKIE